MSIETGMVDKLALIISGAPFPSERSRAKARAVLECLRTPTPEMVEAMRVDIAAGESAMAFTAAIDRALSHTQGEGE